VRARWPIAANPTMPDNWVIFTLAGERFAIPIAAVDLIASPPALCRIPHAAPALLGAGNLGGQILPILDPAPWLDGEQPERRYNGRGEVLRLSAGGGRVGMWVDRVEALIGGDAELPTAPTPDAICVGHIADGERRVTLLDPAALAAAALAPPALGFGTPGALGDVAEMVLPSATRTIAESSFLVEVAGGRFRLPQDGVVELVASVPWTRVPRAPRGLLGIGVRRGAAHPVLSLAALLGLPEPAEPSSFAVVAVDQQRIFLAIDRVLGLEPGVTGAAIDLNALLPDELRDIVQSFPRPEESVAPGPSEQRDGTVQHLAFALGGQDFAVPIASVERVLGPQALIALPARQNSTGEDVEIAAAIELRGQIVPVAALHARLGLMPGGAQPNAFAILQGATGLFAIAADRVDRLVALRPDEITPQPGENGLIAGVVAPRDGRAMLRVLAPERLWGG
jgi:purine-binding chemotaxis protein CheW